MGNPKSENVYQKIMNIYYRIYLSHLVVFVKKTVGSTELVIYLYVLAYKRLYVAGIFLGGALEKVQNTSSSMGASTTKEILSVLTVVYGSLPGVV